MNPTTSAYTVYKVKMSRTLLLHFILSCPLLLVYGLISHSSSPPLDHPISFVPSHLVASDITKHYPSTLLRKLFSSVPTRQYAIDHISLELHGGGYYDNTSHKKDGPVLLLGNSSSGKSTLLRLLAGIESVSSGSITSHYNPSGLENIGSSCLPIIITSKPDCFEQKKSVLEQIIHSCSLTTPPPPWLVENLAQHFASTLGLTSTQLDDPPCNLSPSGQYMFGLACACMKSIQPCMVPTLSSSLNLLIPYPIVFLDELFDFEHSDIPLKMAPGLVQLCKDGAIVVVATHKPLPIKEFSSRIITLSAGRILQDQVIV